MVSNMPVGNRCKASKVATGVGNGRAPNERHAPRVTDAAKPRFSQSSGLRRSVATEPATSADVRKGAPVTLADAFANLCSRCDLAYHLDDDDLCAGCRAEIDEQYADLPGARA